MQDVRRKYVPPAVSQLAFNCPHCGALAKQSWFSLHARLMSKDSTPRILDAAGVNEMTFDEVKEVEERERVKKWAKRMTTGRPFIEWNRLGTDVRADLYNVSLSQCFGCNDVAIWIYDRLVWPRQGQAPLPNVDLPNDVREDYVEAGAIVDLSPRGAAALLRLGIQKLCKHLGGKGENINDDIAALVKKGLNVQVQKALDVVRVIGNNAVHPGQIDLRDQRATAENLFQLVNLIAEIMIGQPKHVSTMFDSLPEEARRAVEKRDTAKSP